MRCNAGMSGELLLKAMHWTTADAVYSSVLRLTGVHRQMETHYQERKEALEGPQP